MTLYLGLDPGLLNPWADGKEGFTEVFFSVWYYHPLVNRKICWHKGDRFIVSFSFEWQNLFSLLGVYFQRFLIGDVNHQGLLGKWHYEPETHCFTLFKKRLWAICWVYHFKKKKIFLKFPIMTDETDLEVSTLDFFIFAPVFSWQIEEFNKKGTHDSKTNRV